MSGIYRRRDGYGRISADPFALFPRLRAHRTRMSAPAHFASHRRSRDARVPQAAASTKAKGAKRDNVRFLDLAILASNSRPSVPRAKLPR